MKTTKLTTLLFGMLAAVAAGCGEEEASETEDADAAGLTTDQLAGTWATTCMTVGTHYEIRSITFKDHRFAYTNTVYSDAACAETDNVIYGAGGYELKGASDKVAGGIKIDYTFQVYTWTFKASPQLAVDYAEACESTSSGDVVQIGGKTCKMTDTASLTFASPAYGTVLLSGTDKLYLSTYLTNGATDALRSADVNSKGTAWTKSATTGTALFGY